MSSTQATFNPLANSRNRLGLTTFETGVLFWLSSAVLFLVLVANQTHIETIDQIKLAPRLELLIRLAGTGMAGLIGIYGFLCMRRVQLAMFSFPGIWVTGIALCYLLSTAFSEHKAEALPHLMTFSCIFLFAPTAFAIMGTRRFVEITILALLTSLLASWFLYLFMPEYGVQLEITDGDTGEGVLRMGGTSHPNTLAGVAGFLLMIICYLFFEKRISFLVWAPIVALCLATYVYTQTRVASVAAILSILFAYRMFWVKRKAWPLTFTMIVLSSIGLIWVALGGASGFAAESLTRSGDVNEITSFTGRSDIWEFVIKKIGQSPVVGYGPGVPKLLLDQQGLLLHSHNVVLQQAFTAGVFAGIFAVMMLLNQLAISLTSKAKIAVMITLFVFMNSLTESFVFDYVPGTSTVLWLAALYWPVLDDGTLNAYDEDEPTESTEE